jgi:hypothetical protein
VRPLTDSTNLTWTRARLEQERTDWWDTQVTGSAEIWGAIRIAAQHLQKGEVAEAQTMLDATGCTCPNGMLWKGVYGPTGVLYKAPEWLFVEPEGLAEEGEEEGKDDEDDERGSGVREAGGAASQVPGAAEVEADEGAELEAEKDETAAVRIRTSHDQKDVTVHIRQRETVGAIVQKLKQQIEVRSIHPISHLSCCRNKVTNNTPALALDACQARLRRPSLPRQRHAERKHLLELCKRAYARRPGAGVAGKPS